jgi:hypothetical protein
MEEDDDDNDDDDDEVWGPSGTLVKEEGSPELISDYGAQRDRL